MFLLRVSTQVDLTSAQVNLTARISVIVARNKRNGIARIFTTKRVIPSNFLAFAFQPFKNIQFKFNAINYCGVPFDNIVFQKNQFKLW